MCSGLGTHSAILGSIGAGNTREGNRTRVRLQPDGYPEQRLGFPAQSAELRAQSLHSPSPNEMPTMRAAVTMSPFGSTVRVPPAMTLSGTSVTSPFQ